VLLITDEVLDPATLGAVLAPAGLHLDQVPRGLCTPGDLARAHVVLVEIGQPDFDGLVLCRAIRASGGVPLVALVTRSAAAHHDRVLRAGADAVLCGPLPPRDLISSIISARHRQHVPRTARTHVRRSDVTVNLLRQQVTAGDRTVLLTRREYQVLALICAEDGAVCSREQLVAEIWGGPVTAAVDNSLNVHVATLRGKLDRPWLIETVRGIGYRLGDTDCSERPAAGRRHCDAGHSRAS